MTTLKPFRVMLGRYKMANGFIFNVTEHDHGCVYPWIGRYATGPFAGQVDSRTNEGRASIHRHCDGDLVARIPDKPAKKRKAAQWGIWVPCKSRSEAREGIAHLRVALPFLGYPSVRRTAKGKK